MIGHTRFVDSVGFLLVMVILAVALPLGGLIAYLVAELASQNRAHASSRIDEVTRDIAGEVRQLYRQADWVLGELASRPAARALDPGMCALEGAALRRARREFNNLVLFSSDGSVICSALPLSPAGQSYRGRTFDRGILEDGTYAGDAIYGPFSRQMVVVMTHPVKAEGGRSLGLVSLTVTIGYLEEVLAEMRLPAGYVAKIVDRSGNMIARTPEPPGFRGEYRFVTVPETGWRIFGAIDEDALLGAYSRRMAQSLAVALLVLLASLLLATRFAERIRRPLRGLAIAALAAARGDTRARAGVTEPGEIPAVARQFDRTLDTLVALSSRLLRVAEEERAHIARELHDQVGQALTALELDLKALRRSGGERERIERCLQVLAQVHEQVRDLSLDLRPSQLDDLGLVAALRAHLERHVAPAGLEVRFDAAVDESRLSPDLETACFRISQEALTNALRHAGARRLGIDLRTADGRLHLSIRDDGKGFDVEEALRGASAGASSGLRNMLDRATLAGGNLEVGSRPGTGTRIDVWLPLP